jgi:anti-sigma factor RsiW
VSHPSRDDVAAYALGALEPPEAEEMKAHLDGCGECRADLRWFAPAVEVLPESVAQLEAPAELRERLLAEVESEAADRKAAPAAREPPTSRIASIFLRPATGLAAAAVVAAGVGGYALRDDAEETETFPVSAAVPGSSATLEVSDESATLQARRVPRAPKGSVYQVWVEEDGKVVPSSLLVPREDGTAAAPVPEVLHGADAVMVTQEPGHGRTRPGSPPISSASL